MKIASDPSEPPSAILPHSYRKVSSALFYGLSSILVIFTNKAVMTSFKFPYVDFLATVQFLVTTFIMGLLILMRKIDVPPLSWSIVVEILPITLMFLGNVICGLGSTNALSIPMFTALRRFSILMILLAEWCLLSVKPSSSVSFSIGLMVMGTVVAALGDLSYDARGYFLVFLNNIFTALNGVYMKKASISGKVSKMGVLFYNSFFSALIMIAFFAVEHSYTASYSASGSASGSLFSFSPLSLRGSSDLMSVGHTAPLSVPALSSAALSSAALSSAALSSAALSSAALPSSLPSSLSTLSKVYAHSAWQDESFIAMFCVAAAMGSVLNYSIFLCTTWNSALTTAVIGVTKNIAATYIGMVAFPDYTFSLLNFLGINLSIVGSLYYNYVTIVKGAVGYGGA